MSGASLDLKLRWAIIMLFLAGGTYALWLLQLKKLRWNPGNSEGFNVLLDFAALPVPCLFLLLAFVLFVMR